MLEERRDKLDLVAKKLEETETLDEDDIEKLIGAPLYQRPARTE
jgi:hypothetical protein